MCSSDLFPSHDNEGLNKERKLFDKVRIGQNSESSDAESSSF